MDRLTIPYPDGSIQLKDDNMNAAVELLSNYEDTGLTPADINAMYEAIEYLHTPLWWMKEVANADVEERLIVSPLRVGQTVWYVPPASFTWMKRCVYECQVVSLTITQNKKGKWTKKFRCSVVEDEHTTYDTHDWSFDEIGKVIFMTNKEAENYLKKENN